MELIQLSLSPNQFQRLPQNRPLWLSLTIPWQDVDFLALLQVVAERPRFYWDSRAHPVSLVSWGEAAVVTDWGVRRFHDLQAQVEHLSTRYYPINPEAPLEAGPRWIGGFSFLPLTSEDLLWRAFPDAYFVLPHLQLARLDEQVWLTLNYMVEQAPDPSELEAYFNSNITELFNLQELVARQTSPFAEEVTSERLQPQITAGVSRQTWQGMVEGALECISQDEFKKVVLARTLNVKFSQPVPVIDILDKLATRYPDCYRFMIEPKPGQAFLGASPELLAEVRAPLFHTTALAGTVRRGNTQEEDEQLGQFLLSNPKDHQEHEIVINAIRENLASLAESLEVAPVPKLRVLGNLMHLETPFQGRLRRGWGVLDVAAALHPTPALGGWPRQAAQAYLAEAEPFERGWYAAPVGWVDPWGNGIFAVAIRSGIINNQSATLFAGAGIVADSNPANEWYETGLKFKPMVEALGGALPNG